MTADCMRVNPHINFGGECKSAFEFYQRCFNAKITLLLTWGDSPMRKEVPPEWHGKICHANLVIGNSELTGVDDPFEAYEQPRSFQLTLDVDDPDQAGRIFIALSQQGRVKAALQKTFWADRYGSLVDRFGVAWEINCGRGIPPQERPRENE